MDAATLKIKIVRALNNTIKIMEKELTADFITNIEYKIYTKRPSDFYKRTYQMLKLKIKGEYEPSKQMVFFYISNFNALKPKKVTYDYLNRKKNGKWFFNSHMSIYGEDNHEAIPLWWDKGTKNESGFPSLPETNIWSDLWKGSLYQINNKMFQIEFEKQLQMQIR